MATNYNHSAILERFSNMGLDAEGVVKVSDIKKDPEVMSLLGFNSRTTVATIVEVLESEFAGELEVSKSGRTYVFTRKFQYEAAEVEAKKPAPDFETLKKAVANQIEHTCGILTFEALQNELPYSASVTDLRAVVDTLIASGQAVKFNGLTNGEPDNRVFIDRAVNSEDLQAMVKNALRVEAYSHSEPVKGVTPMQVYDSQTNCFRCYRYRLNAIEIALAASANIVKLSNGLYNLQQEPVKVEEPKTATLELVVKDTIERLARQELNGRSNREYLIQSGEIALKMNLPVKSVVDCVSAIRAKAERLILGYFKKHHHGYIIDVARYLYQHKFTSDVTNACLWARDCIIKLVACGEVLKSSDYGGLRPDIDSRLLFLPAYG